MSDLVTITTFNNAFEANLAAGHLEREGIDTFIFDQNISALYPNVGGPVNLIFGSPSGGFGGVKLQVKNEDIPKAIVVLKSNGYLKEEDDKPSELSQSLDQVTSSIPFLHKYPLQAKLLAIAFFMLSVVILFVAFKFGVLKQE